MNAIYIFIIVLIHVFLFVVGWSAIWMIFISTAPPIKCKSNKITCKNYNLYFKLKQSFSSYEIMVLNVIREKKTFVTCRFCNKTNIFLITITLAPNVHNYVYQTLTWILCFGKQSLSFILSTSIEWYSSYHQ